MTGETETQDHAAEIERKRAEIARLEVEIEVHRKALCQRLAPSPFAPARFPDLPRVAGLRFAAAAAGVRGGRMLARARSWRAR